MAAGSATVDLEQVYNYYNQNNTICADVSYSGTGSDAVLDADTDAQKTANSVVMPFGPNLIQLDRSLIITLQQVVQHQQVQLVTVVLVSPMVEHSVQSP